MLMNLHHNKSGLKLSDELTNHPVSKNTTSVQVQINLNLGGKSDHFREQIFRFEHGYLQI